MLGYASAWTNAGGGHGPFERCARWWDATRDIVTGGIPTGISVVPLTEWQDLAALADVARRAAQVTGGRFTLGIGSGRARSLALVAEAVAKLHDDGVRAVYVAALGPRMLELAGERADGVALNWCTAEHAAWGRARVEAAAARVGRGAGVVAVVQYVRACIDDDATLARRAFARHALEYANIPQYRAHFLRMGFAEALTELDARRARGASNDELADALPDAMLARLGYFGPAAGAAAAFRRLARGLDLAIARIVPAREGVDSVLAAVHGCRPAAVTAIQHPLRRL